MPDILIRGVDEAVVERLKQLAVSRGTSLQLEAKRALESAAKYTKEEFLEVARASQARSRHPQSTDSAKLIRESRDA
jgi:hypothetical protein